MFFLLATVFHPIDWNQIESENEVPHYVEVHGFPYQNGELYWFISDQISMRSCCVGNKEVKRQIALVNPPLGLSPQTPVRLKGVINKSSGGFWELNEIQEVKKQRSNGQLFLFIGVFLFFGVIIYQIARKRK
ncbi:hypothetical protein N9Y92_02075 [Chlamydiales bacterium]|nr:hypothetical protein [Chlamydiales bacterium]